MAFPEIGRFSSLAAAFIDRTYLDSESSLFNAAWKFLKLRLIYLMLFLPLLAFDVLTSTLLVKINYLLFFILPSSLQNKFLNLPKYNRLFLKNISSLLAYVLGFINPKLIAFYFLPETKSKDIVSGSKLYTQSDVNLKQPKNEAGLLELVKEAIDNGYKLIPIGAGMSQGQQFMPADTNQIAWTIDLRNFNSIEVNPDDKTMIVGSGALWENIQSIIDEHKLALRVMQGSNIFSVGGSLGANIHGWNHRDGVLATTVISIDVINPQGQLETIDRGHSLFHKIIGGYGLFGIIVKAKIKLTDNELLYENTSQISIAQYPAYFRKQVQPDNTIRMHVVRLSIDPGNLFATGAVINHIKKDKLEPTVSPFRLVPERRRGSPMDQLSINLARHFSFIRKWYAKWKTNDLLKNNKPPKTTNQIMQPTIKGMFNPSVSETEWLQEFFLPEETLALFTQELSKILMQNNIPVLNATVRFVKKDHDSLLSYAYSEDRFAVVICFNQSLELSEINKTKAWIQTAQKKAIELGGTYYLAYQDVTSWQDFIKAYPNAVNLSQTKREYDPDELFSSRFYQKYIAPERVPPPVASKVNVTEGSAPLITQKPEKNPHNKFPLLSSLRAKKAPMGKLNSHQNVDCSNDLNSLVPHQH